MRFSWGTRIAAAVCIAGLAAPAGPAEGSGGHEYSERPDLARYFEEAGTEGTMVVQRNSSETIEVNRRRVDDRYLPSSTFKIPNTLVALAEGVADGPDHVFPGPRDPFLVGGRAVLPEECNGDITLRDAFRLSCVNVYQEIARQVGGKTYRRSLRRMEYGNERASGAPVDSFWLEGDLAISAREQTAFLRRLHRHRLGFSHQTMREVADMMVTEEREGYVIRSKTGWVFSTEPQVGWWVGWVETADDVVYFALNLDVRQPDHLTARTRIGRAILAEMGVLPA